MERDDGIKIETDGDVYPPSDDSFLLIESFHVKKGEKVLEIGCGSGIVSLHCAKNGAKVTAVDINPKAVELTKKNAKNNNLALDCFLSDVFENVEGKFDTVVFNLPYLPVDEKGPLEKSWSGGEHGVEPLPRLLPELRKHLAENGRLIIVVSSLTDEKELNSLLSGYVVETLSEESFFFEKIRVLKVTF